METKQQRRLETIQQNHPTRGKQEHNHKGYIQTSRKKLKKILQDTIGTKRIRTDKPKRTNNKEIKEARKIMKENRNKFQTACKYASEKRKVGTRKEYIERGGGGGGGGVLSVIEYATPIDEIARVKTKKPRIQNRNKYHPGFTIVDGRCLPHPPRPGQTARNTRYYRPCGKQIPYPIRSSKMQSD